jgi:hypothetical protein
VVEGKNYSTHPTISFLSILSIWTRTLNFGMASQVFYHYWPYPTLSWYTSLWPLNKSQNFKLYCLLRASKFLSPKLTYYSENFHLANESFIFSFKSVYYKSYRQVQTPVNNLQRLLMLPIFNKTKLVAFHFKV